MGESSPDRMRSSMVEPLPEKAGWRPHSSRSGFQRNSSILATVCLQTSSMARVAATMTAASA